MNADKPATPDPDRYHVPGEDAPLSTPDFISSFDSLDVSTERKVETSPSESMTNLVELSSSSLPAVRGYRLVTVEVLIFLFFLAITLTYPVQTALFLVHTCRSTLGLNATTCAALEGKSNVALEALVQPEANMFIMAASLIEACCPALLSLFVGPWSDKHGRKTFLTTPLLGYVLKFVTLLVISLFPTLPPAYLLIASVPVSVSGGMVSVISLSYCYITDITTESQRGFRMGVFEACFYMGLLVGTGSSTYVFWYGGYTAVYGTSCALCLAAFVYTVFFLPESVQGAKCGCLVGLLDVRLVRDMVRTCTVKRANGRRAIIFLMVVSLSASILAMEGEGAVQFLFTRRKFDWDIQHYTTFGSVGILLNIVGTLVGVSLLSRRVGMQDAPVALVSLALKAASSVVCAVSPAWWYLYLASLMGLMGGVAGPLSRSVLSKAVAPQDVGKVFSLLCAVEAVMPLAAAPLYTLVYNATIHTFPGAFYLISAGIFTMDSVLMGVAVVIKRLAAPTAYLSLQVE